VKGNGIRYRTPSVAALVASPAGVGRWRPFAAEGCPIADNLESECVRRFSRSQRVSSVCEVNDFLCVLNIILPMADGLSVVASVVGIATAAVQSVQFLSTTIDNIKGAPDIIRNIKLELQAVEPVLYSLETASRSDGAQIVLSAEVKSAVVNCNRACTDFQTLLDRWMKHSGEEKTFWIDR
jgi:hypothetical protein